MNELLQFSQEPNKGKEAKKQKPVEILFFSQKPKFVLDTLMYYFIWKINGRKIINSIEALGLPFED